MSAYEEAIKRYKAEKEKITSTPDLFSRSSMLISNTAEMIEATASEMTSEIVTTTTTEVLLTEELDAVDVDVEAWNPVVEETAMEEAVFEDELHRGGQPEATLMSELLEIMEQQLCAPLWMVVLLLLSFVVGSLTLYVLIK